MITHDWALQFAREWIDSWNAHDLDRILSHYTDDFQMSSPYIVQFVGEASGTLKGKECVAAYWRAALDRLPDLRFELMEVYAGADSIAIHYRGARGKIVVEVLFFDENHKVIRAAAHYDRD
jgi:ketosteroid isomerase-like protein